MSESDPRGRYDRDKSKRARRREARLRIIAATTSVLGRASTEAPNVSRITKLAGVGRNTFYALFRDGLDAQRAAERKVAADIGRRLDRYLATAHTPIERLRALAQAWVDLAFYDQLAQAGAGRMAADRLRRRLATVLDDARRNGVIASAITERRLAMVVAGWQSVTHAQAGTPSHVSQVARELVDFTLRAFR